MRWRHTSKPKILTDFKTKSQWDHANHQMNVRETTSRKLAPGTTAEGVGATLGGTGKLG